MASAYTTNGAVGSKDCVLVFRLAALKNTGQPIITFDSRSVIITAPAPVHPPTSVVSTSDASAASSASTIKVLEPCNRITASGHSSSSPFPAKALHKKRARDSLSSSENSISSKCGEDDAASGSDATIGAVRLGGAIESPNTPMDLLESVSNDLSTIANCSMAPSKVDTAKNVGDKENISLQQPSEVDALRPVNVAEMPGRTLNINYRFHNTETRLLRRLLNAHGLSEVDETKPFSLMWTGCHVRTDVLRSLMPHQRVNHFPRSTELTRKDRLYKNIEKMQHLRGFRSFDIVPQSFMLPMEYRNLVTAHRSSQKIPWIVKPAASSRGRGIFLVHSVSVLS